MRWPPSTPTRPPLLPPSIRLARSRPAGLLASFAIAADPQSVDAMVALIEPLLESGPELGIDLVATGEVDRLLIPGTVALAPFRSAQAAAAERCGVPALLHDLPNPLAQPADAGRYQTLPAAA